MSTTTEKEALPKEIGALDPNHKWIFLKEAWLIYNSRLPKGQGVTSETFRRWCNKKQHGIIAGHQGGLIVVRKDTIPPGITPIE